MPKSYRTAFIRITAKNETNNDQSIVYIPNDIETNLTNWAKSAGITYWFIQHHAEDVISSHYHIVIKFKNPTNFETIKNRFPFGDIENARNLRNCIQYLIHLNNKEKEQYSWEDVKTNCPGMTPYKTPANLQSTVTVHSILEKINQGEIREFNQFTEIHIEIWSKNKSVIENALTYYRERICMDKHRDINVTFISGTTGLRKTTFAKKFCEDTQKSYCISSSSNDPLQDYKGEDVLILDDLRDSDFKLTDLLKILDNHTKSTVRSRYHNKAFIGTEIIITSFESLSDWYSNVSNSIRINCIGVSVFATSSILTM